MSQRNVQLVIGRLLTDEELRQRFLRGPAETLAELSEQGWDLTRGEIDALMEIDTHLWGRVAAKLPSRLQRCSLRSDTPLSERTP
jgi:hypothetical protein